MSEIIPKSPQEMAAQLMEAYPYVDFTSMGTEQAEQLSKSTDTLRDEVRQLQPYQMTDAELEPKLTDFESRARAAGVWSPIEGEGADERKASAIEKMKGFGYDEKEAVVEAMKALRYNGYLSAIRMDRKQFERVFQGQTGSYIESHVMSHEAEQAAVDMLRERTTDIANISDAERQGIAADFPSGNFLYHGAEAEQLVQILDSGDLVNAQVLYGREKQAAQAEGRETQFIRRNSGFEGISWSMNGIDALPGDRYHLAGFVAAPETIVADGEQLIIPSRPAPNEVLQISGNIEAGKFYDAKTQYELFMNPGTFGEANSVFGNLVAAVTWDKDTNSEIRTEPMLFEAQRGLLTQPDYEERLRGLYSTGEDGTIHLSPDLLQQIDDEIPVAAVWLQAAVDTGRLKDTIFEGMGVPEIVTSLDGENMNDISRVLKRDYMPYEQVLNDASRVADEVIVPVENMYFVAPRKDAERWLKVIARSGHMPKGMLLYDDKKIRLENFSSDHRGDHTELTAELQSAITRREGYIDYEDVLGTPFSDDMRTGAVHHVIAEKHLTYRKVIKKSQGALIIQE
ncbi:MAG: hypothetical protein JWP13_679 [Candidatus Saccharibacteria bacterium]|nr:hypothetical protein [Candidatus Saccharibacteria bacterium]